MIPRTIILAAALFTFACSVPPSSNARERAPELKEVKKAGVSFSYSPRDFAEVEIKKKQKQIAPDIDGAVDEGFAPAHFCFSLKDNPSRYG